MNDFTLGILVGAIFFVIVVATNPWSYHSMAIEAISKCEKALPRNMECEITAVPVRSLKHD